MMAPQKILDYSSATVRFPHLLKRLEGQLSEKDWAGAEQTRNEIDVVSSQLGAWLADTIAAAGN
jgi:hypothetical protein